MTITEARKRCAELRKQINNIQSEYDFDSYARFVGKEKKKPLEKERDKLLIAIIKTENIVPDKNTHLF